MPESVSSVEDAEALARDADAAMANAAQIFSAEEIESAIVRMAGRASASIAGHNAIVMPVMTGGLFTAVRLTAHFDFPYELDRIQVSRYGRELTGQQLRWQVEPSLDCRNRMVLVVDDILDHGVTLTAVKNRLLQEGASQVLTAVLIVKDVERALPVEVDIEGLHCPDRYVFGCGMDYRGYWRGLPALYALAEG